ncbi:MAG: type II toxin-antitoxin system VapC family toxin [Deltaproteobacteria bacterium]|nr:type II toxin-antitoxin system VapC family toxin [Deltaproteobacteria bacterium]
MKRILLDTHAFLWFIYDDPRLSSAAAASIENPEIEKVFSIASVWEIAIKHQIGKLELGMEFDAFVREYLLESAIQLIPVSVVHLIAYSDLPLLHRDPFDRLLIAQSQVLKVPIVTVDSRIAAYDIPVVW